MGFSGEFGEEQCQAALAAMTNADSPDLNNMQTGDMSALYGIMGLGALSADIGQDDDDEYISEEEFQK